MSSHTIPVFLLLLSFTYAANAAPQPVTVNVTSASALLSQIKQTCLAPAVINVIGSASGTIYLLNDTIVPCGQSNLVINGIGLVVFDFSYLRATTCWSSQPSNNSFTMNNIVIKNCMGTAINVQYPTFCLSNVSVYASGAVLSSVSNILGSSVTVGNLSAFDMKPIANSNVVDISASDTFVSDLKIIAGKNFSQNVASGIRVSGVMSLSMENVDIFALKNSMSVSSNGIIALNYIRIVSSGSGLKIQTPMRAFIDNIYVSHVTQGDGISVDGMNLQMPIVYMDNITVDDVSGNGIFIPKGAALNIRHCRVSRSEVGILAQGLANISCVVRENTIGVLMNSSASSYIQYPQSQICMNSHADLQCVGSSVTVFNRSNTQSVCDTSRNVQFGFECEPFFSPYVAKYSTVYNFYVANVPANPDGYPRAVIGVFPTSNLSDADRAFPGPLIRARKGDVLNVTLYNLLDARTTSLHFHGLHQHKNPWVDGVEGITECGVLPGSSVSVKVALAQEGTFWYHSHSGTQYVDGLFGPIVIDDPADVRNGYNYSQDHVLMLQDWFHETGDDLSVIYKGPWGSFKTFTPAYPWTHDNVLINGRGDYDCSYKNLCLAFINQTVHYQCLNERPPYINNCTTNLWPKDKFLCSYRSSARLRFINSGNNLPLFVWIDRHNMTVIMRDGVAVEPYNTPFISIPIGQRLDVIVQCDQDPSFDYLLTVSIDSNFIPTGANYVPLGSLALLSYDADAPENAITQQYHVPAMLKLPGADQLFEYKLNPLVTKFAPPARERIVITYQDAWKDAPGWPLEEWVLNAVTFVPPTEPLLQTDALGYDINSVLRKQEVSGANIPFTRSTNLLNLEYGHVYEIIISGLTQGQQHPFHIHGHTVDFVDVRMSNVSISGPPTPTIPINEAALVIGSGDSFTVPKYGYVAFRFNASNPGPWFMHCHVDWHMKLGMALVVNVGESGSYRHLIESPPPNFRICGRPSQWQNLAPIVAANDAKRNRTST